jgi:hypothetical protein
MGGEEDAVKSWQVDPRVAFIAALDMYKCNSDFAVEIGHTLHLMAFGVAGTKDTSSQYGISDSVGNALWHYCID